MKSYQRSPGHHSKVKALGGIKARQPDHAATAYVVWVGLKKKLSASSTMEAARDLLSDADIEPTIEAVDVVDSYIRAKLNRVEGLEYGKLCEVADAFDRDGIAGIVDVLTGDNPILSDAVIKRIERANSRGVSYP